MRTFLISLLLAALLISTASAEVLTTANPIGQGRWAVLGSGVQNQNVSNNSGYSSLLLGGYVGYGLTDTLDAYIQAGTGSTTGLPAVVTANSLTALGAAVKYQLMKEGDSLPVSVALAAQAKAITAKQTIGTETTMNGSQWTIGLGASKVMIPFIPYCGLAYRSSGGEITEQTQFDITVGTAIAWSEQGAVFVEYTAQSITPTGGTNYSSGQVAGAVAYKI